MFKYIHFIDYNMYFDKRATTKIIGIALLYSVYIVFSLTFIYAYFSQSKEVLVLINQYGEADSEMILLIAVGILGTYVLSSEFRAPPIELNQRKDFSLLPKVEVPQVVLPKVVVEESKI